MPIFRDHVSINVAKNLKAFVNFEAGVTRGEIPTSWQASARNGKAVREARRRSGGLAGPGREKPPMFFLVGQPKSETSWLQATLNSHPEIFCSGEGKFFGRDFRTENPYGQWGGEVSAATGGLGYRHADRPSLYCARGLERPQGMVQQERPLGDERRDRRPHPGYLPPEHGLCFRPGPRRERQADNGRQIPLAHPVPRGDSGVLSRGESHPHNPGRPEPGGGVRIPLVAAGQRPGRLLPHLRREHRTPRLVLRKQGGVRPGQAEHLRRGVAESACVALAGRRREREGERPRLFAGRYFEVRYEDLQKSPEPLFAEMAGFLGAGAEEGFISEIVRKNSFEAKSERELGAEDPKSFLRSGKAGGWKDHFTERDRQIYEKEAGELLAQLNYEVGGRYQCQS